MTNIAVKDTQMIRATAEVAGLDFSAMRMLLLHEASEHGLQVFENTDAAVKIESAYGAFGITALTPGVSLNVEAPNSESLYVIREAIIEHLEHYMPDVANEIRWSDAPQAGVRPPNFQFATVVDRVELCADFLRVTLHLDNPELFTDASIHFRFVLPQPGDTAPEWPSLKENGSVKWPAGDKEMHKPVYTMVEMNAGQAVVDIFRHQGGRIYEWASTVEAGEKVAIIGPGGGGALEESNMLLCGDETAYPAIARILSCLPKGATGEVVLLNHRGATDYPLPMRDGISVTWITDTNQSFPEMTASTLEAMDNPYLWFAGGAEHVKDMRALTKPMNLEKGRSYLGVFWH